MTKEQAREYGKKIMGVFPDDVSIHEVLFVLTTLTASTLGAVQDFNQQSDSADLNHTRSITA